MSAYLKINKPFLLLVLTLVLGLDNFAQSDSLSTNRRFLREEFPVAKFAGAFMGDVNKTQEISFALEAFLEVSDHNLFQFFASTSTTLGINGYPIARRDLKTSNRLRPQAFNDFMLTLYGMKNKISKDQERVNRNGITIGLVTKNASILNYRYGRNTTWRTPEGDIIPSDMISDSAPFGFNTVDILYGTTYSIRFLRTGIQRTSYHRDSNMEINYYAQTLWRVATNLEPLNFNNSIEYKDEESGFPTVFPAGVYDLETEPDNSSGGLAMNKGLNFSAGVRGHIMGKRKRSGILFKLEGGLMSSYVSNTSNFDTNLPLYFNFRFGFVFGTNGMSPFIEDEKTNP